MFDHVTIRVTNPGEAERFYRTVLGALRIAPTHTGGELVEWDDFSIAPAERHRPATRNLHIGFVAPSREHVHAFWQAGVGAGYRDDGAPGERAQYRPDYYGAFLLDPDGNSAEAVHHGDTRRGGHIDHLWIRVRDLDAAEAFYSAIARHTGLREGRRWPEGRQFRGAWATFSLLSDGRAVTEHLHIAFPAPDRRTVDDFHEAATTAGYASNGGPGERPEYHPGYYGAYVLDPDGTNVESVFHERR
jgi:catechol 2,3-dioxygenase-like lactoylglutathione lyase family enzyme